MAVFGLFSGSKEPIIGLLRGSAIEPLLYKLHNGNSIVFTLSSGYLVSLFFWFIVVYVPNIQHRRVIKNNLSNYYNNFKEDTIQILLWGSIGTHDSNLPKELCDFRKFRDFFKQDQSKHWYAVLNKLEDDNTLLNDLIVELDMLANEVSYALNNINFTDPKIHSFFKRLSENVYRLKNSSIYTGDHVKSLGRFLWEILAQWSYVDGQREEDIIQNMIDSI